MQQPHHRPVLLEPTKALLAPALQHHPAPVIADCTAGLGGHAAALAAAAASPPTVLLFDLDPTNLAHAAQHVRDARPDATVLPHHANFAEAPRLLTAANRHANAVLADLGFASPHMDDPARGFAFKHHGPLDMRYDAASPTTAHHLVNTLPETELAQLIREFGEEPAAKRIARAIATARADTPIDSTTQLADIIRATASAPRARRNNPKQPPGKPAIDPATRTFQALRIAVNDELAALDALLEAVSRGALAARANPQSAWLAPDARVAVITFHSLEDRRVKNAFRSLTDRALATTLTKKPIAPTDEEVHDNRRARSARIRAVQLTANPNDPQ